MRSHHGYFTLNRMRTPWLLLIVFTISSIYARAETSVWFEVKRETSQIFEAKRPEAPIPLYMHGHSCGRKTQSIAHVNIFTRSNGPGVEAELRSKVGDIQNEARKYGADAVVTEGPFIINQYNSDGSVKEVVWPVKFVRFIDEKQVDRRQEVDFLKILQSTTDLNPIEGLWLDATSGQRVAIVRDPGLIGSFIGVQYHSPDEEYRGLITMRISELNAGTYGGTFMLDSYCLLTPQFNVSTGEMTIVDKYDNNITRPSSLPKPTSPNYTITEFKFKKLYPPMTQGARPVPSREIPPRSVDQSMPAMFGSGLVCTELGHFFTNNHVIAGSKKVFVVRYANGEMISKMPAQVIATDPKLDIAILRVEGWTPPTGLPAIPPPLVPSSAAKLGDEVFVLGFPLPGMVSSNVKFTRGSISDTAGIGDDASRIQHTAQIQPGNSGGPMSLVDGRVIGVVVSTLRAEGMLRTSGVVPQGVNFSIKAEYVIQNFQKLGIALPASSLSNDPIGHVKAYTVQVMAER